MKVNIKEQDCLFYVNEEKKTVTCVINTPRPLWSMKFQTFLRTNCKKPMPSRFVGVARCDPRDEFNEEIGRKIAYYKAKQRFFNAFFKRANEYVNYRDMLLNEEVDKFTKLGISVTENLNKLEQQLIPYMRDGEENETV